MQLRYLLASLFASGEVTAMYLGNINPNTTANGTLSITLDTSSPSITFADGTSMVPAEQDCWKDPLAPPIASNSTKYSKGECSVCVSQHQDYSPVLTIGSKHNFRVQIRDSDNHDMGTADRTLAAYGGETGGMDTLLTMTVGGKAFHLWSMADPADPSWAAVYMDWDGPGPANPFAQPPMVYSPLDEDSDVGVLRCVSRAVAPHNTKAYFQCGFTC